MKAFVFVFRRRVLVKKDRDACAGSRRENASRLTPRSPASAKEQKTAFRCKQRVKCCCVEGVGGVGGAVVAEGTSGGH